jgi:hypothetical protein
VGSVKDYEGRDALAVSIRQKKVIGKTMGRHGMQRERWRVLLV